MTTGDPLYFQQQRDRWIADLATGRARTYEASDTKERIHDVARELLTSIPKCIDEADRKSVVAYRVGIMKLAEALTGQSAVEADRITIDRELATHKATSEQTHTPSPPSRH